MEKLHDNKKVERNELRAKVHVKQTELEDKQKDLAEREDEVRQLRLKLRGIQQKAAAQKIPGAMDVLNNNKYDQNN